MPKPSNKLKPLFLIVTVTLFLCGKNIFTSLKLTSLEYGDVGLDFTSPQSFDPARKKHSPGNNYAGPSFSACLLVMDDNHRLPEWLSYHYYALPLRHLIIAVDPASRQNPPSIPRRFYDLMTITLWNDIDYVPKQYNLTRNPNDSPDDRRGKYIQRQGHLHYACSKYFKKRNRTWTAFHDIDEYLTISHDFFSPQNSRFKHESLAPDEFIKSTSPITKSNNITAFMRKPGYVMRLLQTYLAEPSNTSAVHEVLSKTCVHIPRAKYGAIESSVDAIQKDVPSFIHADQLDTLRYRYRATTRSLGSDRGRDGLAKAILDFSRIPLDKMGSGGLVHRPLPDICPKKTSFASYGYLPLGIQHYLGSLESYSFRDDANTKRKNWEHWAHSKDGGPDDEIRPWIQGFVDSVGPSLASELLEGAGVLPNKEQNNDNNMTQDQ